jgi:hypothetical protein
MSKETHLRQVLDCGIVIVVRSPIIVAEILAVGKLEMGSEIPSMESGRTS